MAPKEKEQFTVLCDGLFLNDAKPEKWTQTFPWKPSVGFHYYQLDDAGESIGEVEKKYLKDMWLWQSMGGQNAKGRYFKLQAEHGEVPAKGTQPAKPYVSVMPIAEIFADGTARFLEPPKDGKISVPASTAKPPVTKTPPPETGDEAQDPPTPPVRTTVVKKVPTMAERAATFLDYVSMPQSDAWWTLKNQLGYDGADACNVLDFAKHLAVMENASHSGTPEEVRADVNESLDYWTANIRARLIGSKFQNIQERLLHLVTLCQTEVHIQELIDRAYRELPLSGYDAVRNAALVQYKAIKDGTVKVTGTIQPEVKEELDPVEEEIIARLENNQGVGDLIKPPTPSVPALDESSVKQCETAIGKFTDFTKLLAYWESGAAPYKAHEGLRDAFRLQVLNMFMKAEVQGGIDPVTVFAKTPACLQTPSWVEAIKTRWSELPPF